MDDDHKEENEFDADFDPKNPKSGIVDDDIDTELDDGLVHEEVPVDPLLVDDEVSLDEALDEEEALDDDSMDDKDNEYGI